jgi:hypothetical protein
LNPPSLFTSYDALGGVQQPDNFLMKTIMLCHNVFLTLLSLYMCVKILYEAYTHKCVPPCLSRRTLLARAVRGTLPHSMMAHTPLTAPPRPASHTADTFHRRVFCTSSPRGWDLPSGVSSTGKPTQIRVPNALPHLLSLSVGRTARHSYTLWGNAYDPSHTAMAEVIWIFYVSKIYEFMDTFIMILKGNTHQVGRRRGGVELPLG